MHFRMKLCMVFVLSFLPGVFYAEGAVDSALLFHYRFSEQVPQLDLHGKARIADGVLKLDGNNSFATVPDSSELHLTEKGLTIVGVVKFRDQGRQGGTNDAHDMIMSKGKEFIFGRNGEKMYVNFHDGTQWAATTMGGEIPEVDTWTHFAAVIEHFDDTAQGDVGYRVSIFINGEPEIRQRFQMVAPKPVDALIEIGTGFGGGPWFLNGDIAEIALYQRPLNDAEIACMADECKLVKIVKKGFIEIESELKGSLQNLEEKASPSGRWILNAIRRAASTGYDQGNLLFLVQKLDALVTLDDIVMQAAVLNKASDDFAIYLTHSLAVFLIRGEGTGAFPMAGVMNRRTQRDLFGERSFSWAAAWRKGTQVQEISNQSPGITWQVSRVRNSSKKTSFRITWNGTAPFAFTAVSDILVEGSRIESDFKVKNHTRDAVITDVVYPSCTFAKLPDKRDYMILPWMSGIEVSNPTEEQFRFGQEGIYPSGRVTMQFMAYYAQSTGIYFAFEDPLARSKYYSAIGRRNNLNISWKSPVVCEVNEEGGNDFAIHGKAVVEIYQGDWFAAGQIYRRFLEERAAWWIKKLPRKSTPEWFRNNTLWFLASTKDRVAGEQMVAEAKYLRTYFELPFGIHWYGWDDPGKGGWPHFYPKDFTVELNRDLREAGIYTKPYIDTRLWQVNDGPDGNDWMYQSHGMKYAVKNFDGSVNQEVYGPKSVFTVMCPAAKGWQDWIVGLSERVSSYGFDAIYHDQVGTGGPRLCHDKTHGHDLNDSSVWLEQGYWPMFWAIQKALRKKYSHVCHTTEENAEPYLQVMDGYMVWRWTDAGQIPLYQSIYSGRAQFVGRLYNHSKPGDEQSFFSKIGQQFINSEQIGWFTINSLREPSERRLFVKKLMHLRYALLPWFNEGRMLEPLAFKEPMPMENSLWGGNAPQVVTMPKIVNSSWLGEDGSRIDIFVNTTGELLTVNPVRNAGKYWVCREGASEAVLATEARPVSLAPRQSEVWLTGRETQARQLQAVMHKISLFDQGQSAFSIARLMMKKLSVRAKQWITPELISGVVSCTIAEDKQRVGWISDGALIAFGEVDFGRPGARILEISLGVDPNYQGGSVDVLAYSPGDKEEVVGTVKLQSTGGFKNYQLMQVKFEQALTGKKYVVFRINGNAACDFEKWRFLE